MIESQGCRLCGPPSLIVPTKISALQIVVQHFFMFIVYASFFERCLASYRNHHIFFFFLSANLWTLQQRCFSVLDHCHTRTHIQTDRHNLLIDRVRL